MHKIPHVCISGYYQIQNAIHRLTFLVTYLNATWLVIDRLLLMHCLQKQQQKNHIKASKANATVYTEKYKDLCFEGHSNDENKYPFINLK